MINNQFKLKPPLREINIQNLNGVWHGFKNIMPTGDVLIVLIIHNFDYILIPTKKGYKFTGNLSLSYELHKNIMILDLQNTVLIEIVQLFDDKISMRVRIKNIDYYFFKSN